jgi:hypothetical protein
MQTPYFQSFVKTVGEEDILRGELVLKVVKRVGGFLARECR